jgi:hypothetical protein
LTKNGLYLISSCVDGSVSVYSEVLSLGNAIIYHPLS